MGLLAKLFKKMDKKVNIAMCGLDNAGKTSILNFLKNGEPQETIATMGINFEKLKLGKLSLSIMDLGGQQVFRQFWPIYIERADILIFVVDSNDITRLPQARDIFHQAANNYCTPNIPILILATKQDLTNVCSIAYIIQNFQLTSMFERTIHIQKTSARTGLGIYEAFQWIHDQVLEPKIKRIDKAIPPTFVPKPS
ncbi:MAG TPA: Arf family protein [candidate division Zixibacteria bacterium]|nr:Arf family protein [candidate division Zixibacteria bacterium]